MPDSSQKPRRPFGEILRQLRRQAFPYHGGIKECARRLNVNPPQWSRWEAGVILPSEENQRRIADLLGVNVSVLRGDMPLEPEPAGCPLCREKDRVIAEREAVIRDRDETIRYKDQVIRELEAEMVARGRELMQVKENEVMSIKEAFHALKAMVTGKDHIPNKPSAKKRAPSDSENAE